MEGLPRLEITSGYALGYNNAITGTNPYCWTLTYPRGSDISVTETITETEIIDPALTETDLRICSMEFAECWLLNVDNKLFVSAK